LVATEQEDKMIAPAENVQDKIAFIFNNLSQVNLQTKVQKLWFFKKYILQIVFITLS